MLDLMRSFCRPLHSRYQLFLLQLYSCQSKQRRISLEDRNASLFARVLEVQAARTVVSIAVFIAAGNVPFEKASRDGQLILSRNQWNDQSWALSMICFSCIGLFQFTFWEFMEVLCRFHYSWYLVAYVNDDWAMLAVWEIFIC